MQPDDRFRAEAHAWLEEHAPPLRARREAAANDGEQFDAGRAWQRELFDGGWAGIAWPVEYGGRGATPAQASADTVLAIIAEKTGYPVEALAAEMDLEADLGIDSIKRVEILAAVNERVPGLDSSKVSPADVRRISDLLALLEGSPANPQQAATR